MKKENENKTYKVMFNKGKGGTYTARVIVPSTIVKDLNIRAGDKIVYERIQSGVILRKVEV